MFGATVCKSSDLCSLDLYCAKEKPGYEVVRNSLISSINEGFRNADMVVLSAEDGSGKTVSARQFAQNALEKDYQGYYCCLDFAHGKDIEQKLTRLVSLCEKTDASDDETTSKLVVIDDLKYVAPSEVEAIRALLKRLVDLHYKILITMQKEAEYIIEDICPVAFIRSDEFVVEQHEFGRWGIKKDVASRSDVLYSTQGIANLLSVLYKTLNFKDRPSKSKTSELSFDNQLKRDVKNLLRPYLSEEEKSLRLVMLLLGQGTYSDLVWVLGKAKRDILHIIERDAKFFGLNRTLSTFRCASYHSKVLLVGVEQALGQDLVNYREVIWRCLELLAAKSDFVCVGEIVDNVLGMYDSERAALTWPLNMSDTGRYDLVESAVGHLGDFEEVTQEQKDISRALVYLYSYKVPAADALIEELSQNPDVNTSQLAELIEIRNSCVLRSTLQPDALIPSDHLACTTALYDRYSCHNQAFIYLYQGYFDLAYQELVRIEKVDSINLVSQALLMCDFNIARNFLGDSLSDEMRAYIKEAESLLETCGCRGVKRYVTCERYICQLFLGNNISDDKIDRSLAAAQAKNEIVLYKAFLIIASMNDATSTARLLRAHTRILIAGHIRDNINTPYLDKLCNKIDALLMYLLDGAPEVEGLHLESWGKDDLVYKAVVSCLAKDGALKDRTSTSAKEYLEHNNVWQLSYLSNLTPALSDSLETGLSDTWKEMINQFKAYLKGEKSLELKEESQAQASSGSAMLTMKTPAKLSICLLGSQNIKIGDTPIDESKWRRRASRDLLFLLASTDNHIVSRAHAIEALWPDADFVTGRNSLYTALSVLRKTLGQKHGSDLYVVTTKGYISLNMQNVVCDVDEFQDLALKVLSKEYVEANLLELCEKIRDIYAGDLLLNICDTTGHFVYQRNKLAKMFADAMAKGAETALRTGRPKAAIWCAQDAMEVDETREDVVGLLMVALASLGRTYEAHTIYERFCHKLYETFGTRPSGKMRKLDASLARSSLAVS